MHTDRGISGAEGYLTRNDVVGICTKKGWFCDEESSDQYSRILAVSKDGIDVRDLAAIIWCCGEGDLLKDIEKDIVDYLDRAKKDIEKREARIDGLTQQLTVQLAKWALDNNVGPLLVEYYNLKKEDI